jgi:transcriptional regulator with XRE-family HTH domain
MESSYGFSRPISKAVFIPDYPEFPKNFGEKLRKMRLDQGCQIKDVASAISVTEDSIINWERRGMQPRKDLLKRLLAFYGGVIDCHNLNPSPS